MTNVLAVYPAFEVTANEMAMVWQRLCSAGRVRLTVIARQRDRLKGREAGLSEEQAGNLTVRRFPEGRIGAEDLNSIAGGSSPDVIFCGVRENLPVARTLQRQTGAPILLHVEYFLDDSVLLPRRYHLGLPPFRALSSHLVRRNLRRRCELILCSDPRDFRATVPAGLAYLPWPHPQPALVDTEVVPDARFTAYIGSFSRYKGAGFLLRCFTVLLSRQPDFRLLLIGPPVDREGQALVDRLTSDFPDRVEHRPNCPREEALGHIRRSLFVAVPGRRFGWGLIGDAWNAGTPVLAAAEHYDLEPEKNCLLAGTPESFVHAVQRLQRDTGLRTEIVEGGRRAVQGHRIEVVADVLDAALGKVVGRPMIDRRDR